MEKETIIKTEDYLNTSKYWDMFKNLKIHKVKLGKFKVEKIKHKWRIKINNMKKEKRRKICQKCGGNGFYPSNRYFCVLEMCSCESSRRLHNVDCSISIDIRKTPDWFRRNYLNFITPEE